MRGRETWVLEAAVKATQGKAMNHRWVLLNRETYLYEDFLLGGGQLTVAQAPVSELLVGFSIFYNQ